MNILSQPQALSVGGLADFVQEKPGPRLVILNTVQSAAVFADYLREDRKLGLNVEQILSLTLFEKMHILQALAQLPLPAQPTNPKNHQCLLGF